ncbi:hypothetical protein M427DRAFT_219516 [Gonapodya prolifera JEL478]|uniref:Uncharacterized protein n=1 Tax=Gonapodya prolifera (strain JEL478) TaxID=1344416 RepID=A0A138ZYZ8_GONPJ|nr:hypothetical protein M427DRAFT_219516 [Gonapodya prolifera JEL478]|eukprot:KXS09638.1 hypothetical protein M427DRAFT_219516 [Gonapodya prolifera JEL478]
MSELTLVGFAEGVATFSPNELEAGSFTDGLGIAADPSPERKRRGLFAGLLDVGTKGWRAMGEIATRTADAIAGTTTPGPVKLAHEVISDTSTVNEPMGSKQSRQRTPNNPRNIPSKSFFQTGPVLAAELNGTRQHSEKLNAPPIVQKVLGLSHGPKGYANGHYDTPPIAIEKNRQGARKTIAQALPHSYEPPRTLWAQREPHTRGATVSSLQIQTTFDHSGLNTPTRHASNLNQMAQCVAPSEGPPLIHPVPVRSRNASASSLKSLQMMVGTNSNTIGSTSTFRDPPQAPSLPEAAAQRRKLQDAQGPEQAPRVAKAQYSDPYPGLVLSPCRKQARNETQHTAIGKVMKKNETETSAKERSHSFLSSLPLIGQIAPGKSGVDVLGFCEEGRAGFILEADRRRGNTVTGSLI